MKRATIFACTLAACGGQADSTSLTGDDSRAPVTTMPETSAPEVLASGLVRPSSIALGSDFALVATEGSTLNGEPSANGTIVRVALAGGPPLLLALDARGAGYRTVSTDGTHIYFSATDGRILKMPTNGGTPIELASDEPGIVSLAADDHNLYFTRTHTQTREGGVFRLPKTGGTVTQMAAAQSPRGLIVANDSVYFTAMDKEGGAVLRVPTNGGAALALATRQPSPCGLALHAGELIWANDAPNQGSVAKVALAGGAPSLLSQGEPAPCSVAVQADNVYFAPNRGAGPLKRVAVSGGSSLAVADDAAPADTWVGTVSASASHVIWTTRDAVMRLRVRR